MKFVKLVEDYYSSYDFKNLRDSTKSHYVYLLSHITNTKLDGITIGSRKLKNITTRLAKEAYNLWCENSLSTANYNLAVTRIVFNHGVRMELCMINPFSSVRRRAIKPRKVLWSKEYVKQFLDHAYSDYNSRSIGLIAHMAYEWCQRVGDIRLLEFSNIDFSERVVHIEQSKRRADVHLPIEEDLFHMLEQQREDFGFQTYVAPRPKPVNGNYIPYSKFKLPLHARVVMDNAGIPSELRLSDLRRTGTTEMVEAGVGMGQIMSVTGHVNPNSVKPYMKNTLASANYALTKRKNTGTSILSAEQEE